MGKRYNIAVIGAGGMGSRHVSSWKLAGQNVVALADINTELANNIAKKYDVPNVYADYKEAIASPDVDIVSICLPLAFHAPATIFAAEHGKHVISEKPLCRNMEEAREMEEAIKKSGIQFAVGYQRNLSNETDIVKKWIQEGRFGSPTLIKWETLANVRPKAAMHDYHGNKGPIMDTLSHNFIFYQTVFASRAKKVFATGTAFANKTDNPHLAGFERLAYDTAAISMEYESGDMVSHMVSWGLSKGFKLQKGPDYVIGPKGAAEIHIRKKLVLFEGDQEAEIINTPPEKDLHQLQFETFVDCLENKKPVPTGIKEGKEITAVVLAILESIETGEAVTVKYDE